MLSSEVDEAVWESCRHWLNYASPDKKNYPVKVAQLRESLGSSPDGGGIYRPALREAQFYLALCSLEPFLATAGYARRTFAGGGSVAYFLGDHYPDEWLSWRQLNPERPLRRLLDHIAEGMAERLGVDIY